MRTISKSLTYRGVTKKVTLYVCSPEEYDKVADEHGVSSWGWYTEYVQPRAFAPGDDTIYLVDTVEDDLKLIGHELGHVFGLHHPNDFWGSVKHAFACGLSVMAFTWVLRWRDPDGLVPLAKELLA